MPVICSANLQEIDFYTTSNCLLTWTAYRLFQDHIVYGM